MFHFRMLHEISTLYSQLYVIICWYILLVQTRDSRKLFFYEFASVNGWERMEHEAKLFILYRSDTILKYRPVFRSNYILIVTRTSSPTTLSPTPSSKPYRDAHLLPDSYASYVRVRYRRNV